MYNVEELISDKDIVALLGDCVSNPGSTGILQSAKIKVTPRCNLKCKMCSFHRYAGESELSGPRLIEIVDEFARLGVRKVHFSGGEPLIRSDIIDVIERCAENKIRANITTNGTLVDSETAKNLIKRGIRGVSVSLDAPTAKIHDEVRGVPGAFKKAVGGIERLAAARAKYASGKRVRIRINTVLQSDNVKLLPDIVKLAGEIGVDEVYPMPVDPKHRSQLVKKSEIKDFNLCIAPEVEALRIKYGFSTDPLLVYPFGKSKDEINLSAEGLYGRGYFERNLCYAPWLHIFIGWDGETYPCCMTRGRIDSLGDVNRQKIDGIFFGEKYSSLRRAFVNTRLNDCARCDNFLHENSLLAEAFAANKNARHDCAGLR